MAKTTQAAANGNDYQELVELLDFGFDFQDGLNESLKDGKIDWKDAGNFFSLIGSAGPAFDNLGNPVERYRALTAAKKSDLMAHARERFDLNDDVLEILIEDTLDYIASTINRAVLLAGRWKDRAAA